MASAPHKHSQKVDSVQRQVLAWQAEGCLTMMCTARPGWQTMSFRQPKYKKTFKNIDINLVDILEVNIEKRTVRVEPLVTIGQLTSHLTSLGWTLPVVPELDDLTMGGMINGFGIESSGHKYGLLQQCLVSLELVLPDGSVRFCSESSDPDLFHAVPVSHGTLGFLVSAELSIIPCRSHVDLTYLPVTDLTSLVDTFSRAARDTDNDFVECLMYGLNRGVVMSGRMTDLPPGAKANHIGWFFKPWFYKHVETFLTANTAGRDFIPLRDYYHRHTKSLFWEMESVVPCGNHPLFRWLLGWTMPPKVSFLKLTQPKAMKRLYEANHMDQDFLVPLDTLDQTLVFFDREIKIYPVWLCPYISPSQPGFLQPRGSPGGSQDNGGGDPRLYVDVGLYGKPKVPGYIPQQHTRTLEKYVRSVAGFQMLYADSYQTREEFHEMFDHTLYKSVRHRLPLADRAFPHLYDKVSRKARD